MLNQRDKMKAMKCLYADAEMELTRDALETMLEEELSKPESEMDAELVQEILTLLEDGPAEDAQEQSWKQIEERLSRKQMYPAAKWAIRVAAVLALVLGMTVLTYRTAEAFNWQMLLKWMRPLAETFMLYSGEQPDVAETHAETGVYADSLKNEKSQQYASLDEAPELLQGYPVKPFDMPERLTYLQGSLYSDDLNATVTHVYGSDEGICIFTALIVVGDNKMNAHQYEKTITETTEKVIAGCKVTYYFNSDDATISASWTLDNAQYSLFGAINEVELSSIVEATMNR